MSGVFTPHPPTARRVFTSRFWCGGRTHSLGGEGVGGQRRQTLLCTLCMYITLWYLQSLFRFADILGFLSYLFYTEMKPFIFRILGFGALVRFS
jgi:hypothetical protein